MYFLHTTAENKRKNLLKSTYIYKIALLKCLSEESGMFVCDVKCREQDVAI